MPRSVALKNTEQMTWKKLVITLIYKLKLNTSVNEIEPVLTSVVIFHYHFVRWCKLEIHTVGSIPDYQARKCLHTGTVKIDPNKFCHLKYTSLCYVFKICQNHLFLGSKKQNLETAVLTFFKQENLATIYKMKSYAFQSLLKNITLSLLPAAKFGNINLYQQTVLLKIIYDFRTKTFLWKNRNFWSQKTPFRYVFSIAIMYSCETVWVKVLVSKGWLQLEITVQTLQRKKTNRGKGDGGGRRVKDMEFSGV